VRINANRGDMCELLHCTDGEVGTWITAYGKHGIHLTAYEQVNSAGVTRVIAGKSPG